MNNSIALNKQYIKSPKPNGQIMSANTSLIGHKDDHLKHRDTVRFSGDPVSSTDIYTMLGTWVIKDFAGSFKLSEAEKKAIAELQVPDEFLDGLNSLEEARIGKKNPENAVREAMRSFVKAGTGARTEIQTYKAHSYRMASICAKLLGENALARTYMDQSKIARMAAFKDYNTTEGPTADEKVIKGKLGIKNDLTEIPKSLAMLPFLAVERSMQFLSGSSDKRPVGERPSAVMDWFDKLGPYSTAIWKTSDHVKDKHKELDGEGSDDEWINDRTPNPSTGKGLRHLYTGLDTKMMLAKARSIPEGSYNKGVEGLKELFRLGGPEVYHNAFLEAVNNGELVKTHGFIDSGADVNKASEGEDGFTPLSVAVGRRRPQIVNLLLNNDKIEASKPTKKGLLPFDLAIVNGYTEIAKAFIYSNKVNLNDLVGDGWTPLGRATMEGQTEIVRALINSKKVDLNKKNQGWTPLAVAQEKGYKEIASMLGDAGAKV